LNGSIDNREVVDSMSVEREPGKFLGGHPSRRFAESKMDRSVSFELFRIHFEFDRSGTNTLMDYKAIFAAIAADPRYQANLDWGEPRRGHPEGTVRAHIAELESNLKRLRPYLTDVEVLKLKILIHVHDSFKADAKAGVPILNPESHASLARAFLAEHCADTDLLAMVQYHDEPYALYQQVKSKGSCNRDRYEAMLTAIQDWNLFLAFAIIDGCTEGKGRDPLIWLFSAVEGEVESRFGLADILL
jgi:hypothetical protein